MIRKRFKGFPVFEGLRPKKQMFFEIPECALGNNKIKKMKIKTNNNKSKESKEFRLQAKNIFLTYSQIGDSITKQDFLNFLLIDRGLILTNYIISYEKHNELEGKHCHILLSLEKKPNIRDKNYFNFELNNHKYHAHIERVVFENYVFYVTKEDKNPLTNIENLKYFKKSIFRKQNYKMVVTYLVDIMKEQGLEEALDYFEENATSQMLGLYTNKIIRSLKELECFTLRKELVKGNYPYTNYKKVPEIENYIKEYKSGKLINKTLYTGGAARIGKTEYILAALKQHNTNYTYTKDVEELKEKKIKGVLVLDDCNFKLDLKREEFLQFFETVQPHTLPARFNNPKIPANTPKIIIQNMSFENLLEERGLLKDNAFLGRVISLFLKDSLIIENLNVNININLLPENKPQDN